MILCTNSGQSCICPSIFASTPLFCCRHHRNEGAYGQIFRSDQGEAMAPAFTGVTISRAYLPVMIWLALCSPAMADVCNALTAALLKGLYVPWHSTLTLKVAGKDTKTYEVINTM